MFFLRNTISPVSNFTTIPDESVAADPLTKHEGNMCDLHKNYSAIVAVAILFSVLFSCPSDSIASSESTIQAGQNPSIGLEAPLSITGINTSTTELTLDGVHFSRRELIADFLNTAFSSFVDSRASSFYLTFSGFPDFGRKAFDLSYHWLYQHIYHDAEPPKYMAINKWTRPFVISIGYPHDLKPSSPVDGRGVLLLDSDLHSGDTSIKVMAQQGVEQYINTMIPKLRDLTNLDITFESNPSDRHGIRVILVNETKHWRTPYKRGDKSSVVTTEGNGVVLLFPEAAKMLLPYAVPYTPESAHQVEGFLLPNSNNELEYSFCFIGYHQPAEMIEGLVRECIVRSLGFPGAARQSPTLLLSKWNDKESWNNYYQKRMPTAPPQFGELESTLIKALYSSEMLPGLSAQAAAEILNK